jgi:hypothetical protein
MSLTYHYSSRRRGAVAISDEEIRSLAPSVFASQPIEGVSERYSFLPTSSILRGMRETGWVPVRAIERTLAEYCGLLKDAGLRFSKSTPIRSQMAIIEAVAEVTETTEERRREK